MSWWDKHLLSQIEDLKKERDEFKTKYFELVEKNSAPLVKNPIEKPVVIPHRIVKMENSAMCSCGWDYKSDDEAELQTAISFHHANRAAHGKKRSFAAYRDLAEKQAEREAREKEKTQ